MLITELRVKNCHYHIEYFDSLNVEFVWMRLWSWSQLPLVKGLVSIDRLTTNAACLLHSLARLNRRGNSGQKGSIQIQNKMKTGTIFVVLFGLYIFISINGAANKVLYLCLRSSSKTRESLGCNIEGSHGAVLP